MTEDMKMAAADKLKLITGRLKKSKYLVIMLLAGVVLLLWPSNEEVKTEVAAEVKDETISFDLDVQENKLETILSEVKDAGKVNVMLTLKSTSERILAVDTEIAEAESTAEAEHSVIENTVILSTGSSSDDTVTLKYIYPEYLGAIVVAEGADKAAVKLALTNATAAATGLSSNKIQVIKMK